MDDYYVPVVKSGAVDCHVYFSTGNQESQFREIPMYLFIYLFSIFWRISGNFSHYYAGVILDAYTSLLCSEYVRYPNVVYVSVQSKFSRSFRRIFSYASVATEKRNQNLCLQREKPFLTLIQFSFDVSCNFVCRSLFFTAFSIFDHTSLILKLKLPKACKLKLKFSCTDLHRVNKNHSTMILKNGKKANLNF